MNKNIFLNDFDRKLVLERLKDFNIINFHLSLDGNNARYIFFFYCGEFIFSCGVHYCSDIADNKKPSLYDFINSAKEHIGNSYRHINDEFIYHKENGIDNRNLAQILFVEVYNIHYNSYYCGLIENLSLNTKDMFNFRDECLNKINNGVSAFDIYKNYINRYHKSQDELLKNILN